MFDPTCPRCKTDDYLEYSGYIAPQDRVRVFRTHQGEIRRPHRSHAQVGFTCLACGFFNGHSVPDDWTVPSPNPRVQPSRRYAADGIVRV